MVRNLAGKQIKDKYQPKISEAIRMVCERSFRDPECREIQNCIPSHMQYMGLYPHIMKKINICPSIGLVFEIRDA